VGRNGYGICYVPESNVRAAAELVTSGYYARPCSRQSIRLNSGVNWASAYESAAPLYTVRSNAYLRATPSLQGRSLGQVLRGDEIEAIAKVQGSPWILVGRNGYGVGYVHESVLDSIGPSSDVAFNAPAGDCRIVEQVVTTREYSTQTQRYRACRDSNGSWNFAAV
jgi:hypothetical protein